MSAQDWRMVRHLRLAALLEQPTAFCERWADAAALDDDAWRDRTARGAAGGSSCQVMAWEGARAVASATCRLDGAVAGRAWLYAVHVAPDRRGQGLLERLVQHLAGWARAQGAAALHLEVHEGNARALAAYRRLGFAATGGRRPYPLDPASGGEWELALPLESAPSRSAARPGRSVAGVSDDLAPTAPWPAAAAPPPSLLEADVEHVALSERRDPLDDGFLLAGGVLAPLPPKVRLPHEQDDPAEDDEGTARV